METSAGSAPAGGWNSANGSGLSANAATQSRHVERAAIRSRSADVRVRLHSSLLTALMTPVPWPTSMTLSPWDRCLVFSFLIDLRVFSLLINDCRPVSS